MEKESIGNTPLECNEDIIFSLEKSFPDIENIFVGNKKLNVHSKDTIIFLDTNVLLLAYDSELQDKGLNEIKDLYEKIKKEKRLYISDRVAREFMRNKNNKLSNLILSLDTKLKEIKQIKSLSKIFREEEEFEEMKLLIKEINLKINEYKSKYEGLKKKTELWKDEDPITAMYRKIFNSTNIVVLNMENKEEIMKDWSARKKSKSPPGYNDSEKIDTGIGDFLIWKAMIQLSEKKNKDIIFVTGDQKNDWFNLCDKKPLAIRSELINEFRYHTGRNINIMNFTTFLSLYNNITPSTIDEIKNIESNQLNNLYRYSAGESFKDIMGDVQEKISKMLLMSNEAMSANVFEKLIEQTHERIEKGYFFPEQKILADVLKNELSKLSSQKDK